MATVTYDFDVDTEVWVITDCGIESGVVNVVKIAMYDDESDVRITTTTYYIITDAGILKMDSSDVFGTLADAVAEYEVRLS